MELAALSRLSVVQEVLGGWGFSERHAHIYNLADVCAEKH